MKRRLLLLALVLVFGGVLISSCEKDEELSSKKEILSFIFEASKNAALDQNALGVISGTEITANVPFGTNVNSLIPTIEVSPNAQLTPGSGLAVDFSSTVTFTVTAEDGSTKEFITNVAIAPAPFLGTWKSNAIDFGLGLMYVFVTFTEDGNFSMELKELISGDYDSQSIKGAIEPISMPYEEIKLMQSHQWIDKQWTPVNSERTIMYHFEKDPLMRFYYCYCYPKQDWAFEVDLHKQ